MSLLSRLSWPLCRLTRAPVVALGLVCAWLLLPGVVSASAREGLAIDGTQSYVDVGNRLEYVRDPNSLLDFQSVRQAAWQALPEDSTGVNFGFMSGTLWLRLVIRNTDAHVLRRYMEIGYPILDDIRVRMETPGRMPQEWALGDKHPFSARPVSHRTFVIPLEFVPGPETTLYFRVESTSSLQVPITLWESRHLMSHMQDQYHAFGLYFGAMAVLMFYNLFLFFTVREPHYLFYVMYIAAISMFTSSINGISFQYLWPEATQWNDRSLLVGLAAVVAFAGLFTRNFLELWRHHWLLDRMIVVIVALAALEFALSLFLPYRLGIMLLIVTAIVGISIAMAAGIILWSKGYRPAIVYCVAWFSFLLAGVLLALNKIGVMPRNLFTENALQLGSALEGILLSIALADRLNEEKAQRFKAQRETLEHERIAREAQAEALEQEKNARLAQERALLHEREAREAQASALRLQQRANETLEQKVRERTEELEQLNQRLQELSLTDGLTGIRNRRYFDRRLDELLERSRTDGSPMALLLLDIDHFKRLNDQFGHLVGDDCLKLVASLLAAQVHRDDDTVVRYGGEEFAMLLPDTDQTGALHIAEKVRAAIEGMPFRDATHTIAMTVSIGVRCLGQATAIDAHEFVQEADQALYAAKTAGRNRVSLFTA